MKWVDDFNLFLFDLDGLLVNTENIHYQAYIDMLRKRGFKLEWSFLKFCEAAHFDDDCLKEGIYSVFPKLYEQEPNWEVLKKEKNKIYLELVKSSKIELLRGVEKLLNELQKKNKKSCVVTNSSKPMTDMIRAKQPILKKIPNWVTREAYAFSKPHPESYLHAIKLFGEKGDIIIGFEDSLRGIKALLRTPAIAVLINPILDPRVGSVLTKNFFHFESFEDIEDNFIKNIR